MFKRWLIRGMFLLPLLLCIVGWGWSTNYKVTVAHYELAYGSAGGVVFVAYGAGFEGIWMGGRLDYDIEYLSPSIQFWHPYGPSILGFSMAGDDNALFLAIPYWFLILLFSLALLFVWRKTRPKPSSVTAFPVEINGGNK